MTDDSGVRAVLFDVDGVLRVWEAGQTAEIERRYGVPVGKLSEIAYERDRFGPALLGEISDDDWRASVAAAMVEVCGDVDEAIGCVVDGVPPLISLSESDIQPYLDKRAPGGSRFVTQRQEPDHLIHNESPHAGGL